MNVVVGSGPAGVSCAKALLDRGQPVTMVDAGITLEPEKERLIAPLRAQRREEWSPEAVALLRSGTQPRTSGLQLKLAYGSDYPYQRAEKDLGIERGSVACVPSFARGGLSNVWGGSMLPYRDADISDWPIRSADLAEHHRAVLEWVPHSAVRDRLESVFPTHSKCEAAVPPSRQAAELLADMEESAGSLERAGVVFGRSRVAIDPACIRCGMCMYGCPRDFVFNASKTVGELQRRPGFSYRPGVVVERVRESGAGVDLDTRSLEGDARESIRASRVFLGCGPIATTRIMLASMEAFDREVVLQDSQYYLFPILRQRSTSGVEKEPLHTLAQVFLEIFDQEISRHSVHVQLYSYNDLYERVFEGMLGPARRLMPLGLLLNRMWVAQGYLHSSESPGLGALLTRSANGSQLRVRAIPCAETSDRVKRVVKKVASLSRWLHMAPLGPLAKLGDAGQGYHAGGSFPMRANPGPFETDTLGRPHGFERLHVIDSTTFPSIPANTITFTVMANAHRIGSRATT